MPSGDRRLDRAAEAEGGAAEQGTLDEAFAQGGWAGAVQRACGKWRKDSMPSGELVAAAGRFTAETQRRGGGRARGCRRACRRRIGACDPAVRQIRRKDPMPSGGGCRGGPVWPPIGGWAAPWGRPYGGRTQFSSKHPMPSGAADPQRRDERAHAAAIGSAGAAQGHRLGRIEAVGATGGGAAGAALGRARAGAEAAMHPAAAVLHGRLAAAFARAGPGAAARGGEEVAGRGTVPEPAAPIGGEGGEGPANCSHLGPQRSVD